MTKGVVMKSKVEEVKQMYLAGKKAQAFKTLGKMNNEHLRTLQEKKILVIAGEMLSGNTRFYEQLGYKTDEVAEQAEEIFKLHYGL